MVAVATPDLPRIGQNCDMGDVRRGTLGTLRTNGL